VTYADLGPLEFIPPLVDHAPVVIAPGTVKATPTQNVSFTVTASDTDGDAITSLTMVAVKMPVGNTATFTANATKTGGTFTWNGPLPAGNWQVKFVATNNLTGSATTTIQVKKAITSDESFALGVPGMSEPSPNPSSRAVSFALDLPQASAVDLSVYDMQGRRVYTESHSLPAGRSSVSWSGLDASRQRVGTGMYFVRAQVGSVVMVRRVVRF